MEVNHVPENRTSHCYYCCAGAEEGWMHGPPRSPQCAAGLPKERANSHCSSKQSLKLSAFTTENLTAWPWCTRQPSVRRDCSSWKLVLALGKLLWILERSFYTLEKYILGRNIYILKHCKLQLLKARRTVIFQVWFLDACLFCSSKRELMLKTTSGYFFWLKKREIF